MTDQPYLIAFVDDDPSICDALATIFSMNDYRTKSFYNGDDFIHSLKHETPDALLLDVHMPGKSGIEILKILRDMQIDLPVFILSGQGDIPIAVDAIKSGAHDFLEKPFDSDDILRKVAGVIEKKLLHSSSLKDKGLDFHGHDLLTKREWDVLEEIIKGSSNREAGDVLGISSRTVEVHRARIMEKLNAKNAADLVRIVLSSQAA